MSNGVGRVTGDVPNGVGDNAAREVVGISQMLLDGAVGIMDQCNPCPWESAKTVRARVQQYRYWGHQIFEGGPAVMLRLK